MSATTAMPVYLSFAQWESDLICHEVAVLVQKQGKPDLLLSSLASNLSKVSKRSLVDNSCKLKRFLASASEDFVVKGAGGTEKVTFIGSAARFEKPLNMPLDAEVATAHITTAAAALSKPASRAFVRAEISSVLSEQAKPLLVSQVGSVLSNKSKAWLRSQRVRLLGFLQAEADFAVQECDGQELISLASSEDEFPARKLSVVSMGSTTASESDDVVDGAAFVRSLLGGHSLEAVAHMLAACQPICYED